MYQHHTRSPTVEGESEHQHARPSRTRSRSREQHARGITRYHLALRLHRSGQRRLEQLPRATGAVDISGAQQRISTIGEGRATPVKQRRRLTSAARPRSYCEPRSTQSRSGQARGGSERQYESSDKKRSISATSGHSRWWRWAFMVGGANFHPGCGRSAPTCTPPPHAHACAQSCKFCAACCARASLTEFLLTAVSRPARS